MKKIVFLSVVASLGLGSIAFAEYQGAAEGGKHGVFSRVDANGDGKITRAEADVEIKKFYDTVDSNHDGKVTREEAATLRAEKHAQRSEKLWSSDANKNGTLERAEVSKMPERWFGKVDANSDGVLTRAELEAKGKAMQERFAEHARGKFARVDANSDGVVTLAEVQAKATSMFDRFDDNKDGAVEKSELPKRGRFFGGKHGRGGDCGHGHDKPSDNAAGNAG